MEKRALLAFLASIALFLAYDSLYLSPRVKEQRARRQLELLRQQAVADSLSAIAAPGTTVEPARSVEAAPDTVTERQVQRPAGAAAQAGRGAEPEAEGGLPPVVAPARIVVSSPLYRITLSSAGGEVVSARLLDYTTRGEPVELVPQDSTWAAARLLNLTLQGTTTSLPLEGVGFEAYLGGVGRPLADGTRVSVGGSSRPTEIVFRASRDDGVTIERFYRFYPARYDFEAGVRFPAALFPSATGIWWGMGPGLGSTEANVRDDQQSFKASVKLGEDIHRVKPSHFGKKSSEEFSGTLAWAALQTKYFTTALIPSQPTRATVVVSGDKAEHHITDRVLLPAVEKAGRLEHAVRVYMGPLDYKILEGLGVGLQSNIEMGMRILRPVSWVVLWSLTWTYKFIPNYGLVIIIISVLTKVLFYRLTHKSFKSMKDLQDLQPRIQALKDKYGDDRQKLSQETMKLYKEAGVNPLGGCLPMLLQMPVFIALFQVLRNTIELRQAPFVGWIDDLSQQDVLFRLPVTLPLIGDAFSVLPLLMGVSMVLQTKIGGSITGSPTSQTTPKGFNTMLPIVFTFLFYRMPSGLVIYWIVNTVLSVAQQYYIHREADRDKDGDSGAPVVPPAKKKRRVKSKGR